MAQLSFLGAEGLGKDVANGNNSYRGWFGVGLTSKYYSKENLSAYALWAKEHMSQFVFVLADDLERYNLIGFKGLGDNTALELARQIGDEKMKMLSKLTTAFQNVKIIRWRELSNNKQYKKIFKSLTEDYYTIPELKRDFDNSLFANIREKLNILKSEIGEKEFSDRFRILVNYSLEEVSSIIFLCEHRDYVIKLGHRGERVYDNIVDRIYGKTYTGAKTNNLVNKARGNIYLQAAIS